MGLIDDVATKGLALLGVSTKTGKKKPNYYGPDFSQGFIITEVVDGALRNADRIQLAGRFMPLQPFEYGGEQRVVRDEYPGSSEPTMHVLGPKEGPMTVKGRMKTNKFRGSDNDLAIYRQAAKQYAGLIDAMRIRGNLVRLQLGEWVRYGIITKSVFRLNTLQNIEYDISFDIIGFNPPKGWRVVIDADSNVDKPNKDITNKALEYLTAARQIPDSMPLSAVDILNNMISDVADAIKKVTDFTDGIINDTEKLVGSANRAIGLIKNARATISRSKRQIGSIANTVSGLGASWDSNVKGAIGQVQNVAHITKTSSNFSSLALLLASLQAKFATYTTQIPFRRHLIKQGDTLHNISQKYYNTADNWKKIYDHNKLTTSVLKVGSILEIPKA